MKIFLCLSCLAIIFAGCIIRPDSDISRMIPPPQRLSLLLTLYSDENIAQLKNLHDVNKVSDDEVANLKKFLHNSLANIITSLPKKIDHRDTRISYIPDGGIISYHSVYKHCEASDRSKCFRLELIPAYHPSGSLMSFNIKVWQLPANKGLAEVVKSYSQDKLPFLLQALRKVFPHKLGDEDLTIRYYGREDDRTLHVIAGSAANDNRRELHIKVSDGMIDNTINALFPHIIRSGDVALLDEEAVTLERSESSQ